MRTVSYFRKGRMLGAAVATLALIGAVAVPARAQGTGGGTDGDAAAAVSHAGMTWHVRGQRADGVVNVGADDVTNAYEGDTPARRALPILCLYVDGSPVPEGITPDFYNGWAGGWVALSPAVRGARLTSREVADGICATNFGPAWRMAEHHDGWWGDPPQIGGWHFWARGVVPSQTRFWVAIDDQPANPWS
jgi:hypothetical protein